MNIVEFGFYFAGLREKSGFKSQRQLAIASGVSNGTIARIESGTQKVSPETLKVLAPHLKDVDYDELMIKAGYIDESALDTFHEMEKSPAIKKQSASNETSGGRAYFGGADSYTEEELDVAKAAIEAYRSLKRKNKNKENK
ncbi:helix-turn-helix domain-containing protein [Paenibacillus sp. LMG 31461]|uniref:Helix-turn-helix domain-containing protein n=1 Tax=Paenibacillus plantarum TaxID=2654975 RepID=A0ABX1X426_9BACL|nr:helix-turn-helix transcriptional regulator [Paenibacillus plantarum]NOU63149.1 helix-turn-helix domain-containing protein [Paenibacillus plantarum]